MQAVLDACVLYPTVLREILLGVARMGLYEPRWSERLIEEWIRATAKLGAGAQAVARGEGAILAVRWPQAMVPADGDGDARLILPDPDDRHVLGAALRGQADLIVTLNLRDFPARALAPFGIRALDPDRFLTGFLADHPTAVARVVAAVHTEAERLSGQSIALRALLKRAQLPRLARLLAQDR